MPVEYNVVADLPSTLDISIYILEGLFLLVAVPQSLCSVVRITRALFTRS